MSRNCCREKVFNTGRISEKEDKLAGPECGLRIRTHLDDIDCAKALDLLKFFAMQLLPELLSKGTPLELELLLLERPRTVARSLRRRSSRTCTRHLSALLKTPSPPQDTFPPYLGRRLSRPPTLSPLPSLPTRPLKPVNVRCQIFSRGCPLPPPLNRSAVTDRGMPGSVDARGLVEHHKIEKSSSASCDSLAGHFHF